MGNHKDIGKQIAKYRERAKLTQLDLANALGIQPQTVSNWERGQRKPKLEPEDVLKLCEALNCTLDELVRN